MPTEYETTFYGTRPRAGWSFRLSITLLINLVVYVTVRALLDVPVQSHWLQTYSGLIVLCAPAFWCLWLFWERRRKTEWVPAVLAWTLAMAWLSQAGQLVVRMTPG